MVKYQIGNMWQEKADIYLATTNSVINSNGELVMGAGVAKQMKLRYPESPRLFAESMMNNPGYQKYGVIIIKHLGIGAFQTKYDWMNSPSPIGLIEYSTNKLIEYCKNNPKTTIFLPYPGIGHGGLTKDLVKPIIERLPDAVTIWSLN